jgi:hypothetical protein
VYKEFLKNISEIKNTKISKYNHILNWTPYFELDISDIIPTVKSREINK